MIFIPFRDYRDTMGGPSTFLMNFKAYLDRSGFEYIDNKRFYKKADKIFFPISFNRHILKYFKSKSLPIIQRLDGVYYPSKHGPSYRDLNAEIMLDYQFFSDFVIFQSNYSKESCFNMFGAIEDKKHMIILNGADTGVFNPEEKVFDSGRIVFVTTGVFRSMDMLEPVIKALDILRRDSNNFVLKIIGSIKDKNILPILDRDYVDYMGILGPENVAAELKRSDIFLYTQLNPPCPNSVIEAICCGLPVVGFNGGAMRELLGFQKELLSEASGKLFQEYRDYSIGDFYKKITQCIENYGEFRQRSIQNSKKYDLVKTMDQYLDILKRL